MTSHSTDILVTSLPVMYSIELTSKCNNRCAHCVNRVSELKWSDRPVLQARQWFLLLDKTLTPTSRVRLTGGEPSQHPEFFDIIDYLSKHARSFHLFTNARWPEPKSVADLLSRSLNCTGMLVSLHGPDARTHERFTRVAGSFEETLANIGLAVRAGVPVSVNMVLTTYNYGKIRAMVEIAKKNQIRRVLVSRYVGSRMDESEMLTESQLKDVIREVEDLRQCREPVTFGNHVPQCFHPSKDHGCTAGRTWCTVDPWGRVRPCSHAPMVCGDLRAQDIREIWHGKQMKVWRDLIPTECQSCQAFSICHGGCQAERLVSRLDRDPLCRGPIKTDSPAAIPRDVTLPSNGIPVLRCEIIPEDFGYLLLYKRHILPVAFEARVVLDAMSQHVPIGELAQKFGDVALDLVWQLYLRGFLLIQL